MGSPYTVQNVQALTYKPWVDKNNLEGYLVFPPQGERAISSCRRDAQGLSCQSVDTSWSPRGYSSSTFDPI